MEVLKFNCLIIPNIIIIIFFFFFNPNPYSSQTSISHFLFINSSFSKILYKFSISSSFTQLFYLPSSMFLISVISFVNLILLNRTGRENWNSNILALEGGVYSDDQGSMSKHYYFRSDEFLLDPSLSANEDAESSELFEIELGIEVLSNRKQEDDCQESLFSFDFRKSNHCVYVGISDNFDSSMDALQWTLDFAVLPSTIVYLFHVFPEIRFIPSPLGRLPKNQVNPKLVEKFKAEERAKRREFLHKFVSTCSAAQVNVEVVMIESDMVAKAILDLISLLQIRKLILGRTKARKWRSKRGKGIARHVLQNAEEFCDVKIICEGNESTYQTIESSSSSSSHTTSSPNLSDKNIRFKSVAPCSGFLTWRCFGG